MGLYISPKSLTKKEWLKTNAHLGYGISAWAWEKTNPSVPLAYVDNGGFDAIAVLFNKTEYLRFSHGRPDATYFVAFKTAVETEIGKGIL